MTRTARMSECGLFRYTLGRKWDAAVCKTLAFVMLNPSTADGETDDPTIRKCIGFAKRYGFGAIEVVNLYAFRSTDPLVLPRKLRRHYPADRWRAPVSSFVGSENDWHIGLVTSDPCTSVIAAWGAHGDSHMRRVEEVCGIIKKQMHCLAKTKSGQPTHPLMLPYDLTPGPWNLGDIITRTPSVAGL